MRVVVSSIQQQMKSGIIKDIFHVKTQDQLADVFTKKGVKCQTIIDAVSKGKIEEIDC